MSYTKTTWNNDTAPAINETNLNKIEQGIYDNDSHIGDLSDLETTANTDLVSAINEVDSHADTNATNIGDLTTLTTTAKSNVVSAVNELDSLKATKDVATTSADGLMSASDKGSLDDLAKVRNLLNTPTSTISNLNTTNVGIWSFPTNTTNAPSTTSGKLISMRISNDNYMYQIVICDYTMDIFTRYRYYSGGWKWSGWAKLNYTWISE